jgi:hypothetical protein
MSGLIQRDGEIGVLSDPGLEAPMGLAEKVDIERAGDCCFDFASHLSHSC